MISSRPKEFGVASATEPEFPPGAFDKEDPDDDSRFYVQPRFVTHIDDGAIAALTAFYRDTLPAGGIILDLMSSWVSHLPEDVSYGEVVGHGMNAAELEANPRLKRWFVQDLNRDQKLPLNDAACDAVTICVSIQYLQKPIDVLREAVRILKPGAPLIVSLSNRCFPTKAVAIWRAVFAEGVYGHAQLIAAYMRGAGFDDIKAKVLRDGDFGDPMTAVVGRAGAKAQGDT
jgi:SAM-dependent methyltransferase